MEGSERSEAILALLRKIVDAEIDGVLVFEDHDGQYRAVTADTVLAALETKLKRLNLHVMRGSDVAPLEGRRKVKTRRTVRIGKEPASEYRLRQSL